MNIQKIIFKLKEYFLFIIRGGHHVLKHNHCSVLSMEDSLNQVLSNIQRDTYKGFIRFGDGEYQLIRGLGISFQPASKNLSHELFRALHNVNNLDIDIAIEVPSYKEISGNKMIKRISMFPWSLFYIENTYTGKNYLHTRFTTPYYMSIRSGNYNKDMVSAFIERFNKLFESQKITLFIGEGIYNKISYLPFENSLEVKIEKCPSSDAYAKIDSILNKARTYSTERILCFAIGPASKVASYKLIEEGYRCFDLGHFIKDYDLFKKEDRTIAGFYLPDF